MRVYQILILLLTLSNVYGNEYPNQNYNDSLTYYQNGDLGRAMFYSKRAILLEPSDPQIRNLFYTIRHDIGLPTIYATDSISSQMLSYVFGSLPPHINASIGAVFFVLASILVSLSLLGKLDKHKNITLMSTCGFFIIAGVLFIQAGVQYYFFFSPDQRVVINDTKAYEEPSTESVVLLTLPAGSEVTITMQSEDFYLAKTLDGKEYWIQNIPPLWEDL